LDLAEFKNHRPIELFGQAEFPVISESPYFLMLSPHAAFWFSLEPVASRAQVEAAARAAELCVPDRWEQILERNWRGSLENQLGGFLRHRRWFGGKSRAIKSV